MKITNIEIINDNQIISNESNSYSMLYHDIYRKIHEKQQITEKNHSDCLKIKLEDIEELHYKILQTINSLSPTTIISNIHITQSHGEKLTFSDFSVFKSSNITSPNPTEEVILTYNFIREKNGIDLSPDSFKITIILSSKLTQFENAKNETSDLFLNFLHLFKPTVASIKIEFTDYVPTRSFLAAFDEWINSCDKTLESKYYRLSLMLLTKFDSFIIIIFLSLYIYSAFLITDDVVDEKLLARFLIIFIFLFYFIRATSHSFIRLGRRIINSYFLMSYISLSKGDSKLIALYEKNNSIIKTKACFTALGSILLGVTACYIYDIIKLFIL